MLAAITTELDERMPASMARIEEQALRARSTSAAMLPEVEAVRASADGAANRLSEAEASLSRQQQALDALLANLSEGVASAETQLRALGTAAQDADSAAAQIVAKTGPELIDALLRVREAANQAAERAREAISAVIPQSAAALAAASSERWQGRSAARSRNGWANSARWRRGRWTRRGRLRSGSRGRC
jgi:ABC-type transporter Mla subunit MlaD